MRLESITIDWLKNYKAHFFGLGFIQIKTSSLQRLHFYHHSLPPFVEQPHDHRYNFISSVLRGRLVNSIWEPCFDDALYKQNIQYVNETCRPKDENATASPRSGTVVYAGTFRVDEGSSYYISKNTFHTAAPDYVLGPCVTSMQRTTPEKETARVFYKEGAACPFSRPIPEGELWEIVRECLKR